MLGAAMSGDTTTLVVINLPSGVDGDALVGRFGSVFRSATNSGGGPSDAPPSISPGAVRFTEKQWTVEGVETSVRIAFVDVDGGPKRAATIMSAVSLPPNSAGIDGGASLMCVRE